MPQLVTGHKNKCGISSMLQYRTLALLVVHQEENLSVEDSASVFSMETFGELRVTCGYCGK